MLLNCLSVSLVYFSITLTRDEALLQQVVGRLWGRSLSNLGYARVWCLHSSSPLVHGTPVLHVLLRAGPLLTGRTCDTPDAPAFSLRLREQKSRTVYSAIPSVSPTSLCENFLAEIARDARYTDPAATVLGLKLFGSA